MPIFATGCNFGKSYNSGNISYKYDHLFLFLILEISESAISYLSFISLYLQPFFNICNISITSFSVNFAVADFSP